MRRCSALAVVALGLASLGGDCKKGPAPKPKPVAPSAAEAPPSDDAIAARPPPLALLVTQGGVSRLHHATIDAGRGRLGPELARLSHLDGDVRAALLGDGRVAATAPALRLRDRSFDGALYLLGDEIVPLCDGVIHASAPLALPDGSVLVARGEAGPPRDPALRIDALGIDRVTPDGTLERLHAFAGHLLHLAGFTGREVLIYRVGPDGADIVAIEPEGATLRTVVADLPPFARDFSTDGETLVYRGRDAVDAHRWVVERVDLTSGAVTRLHASDRFALAPHVWRDGGVALSEAEGLLLLGSTDPVAGPLGPGVDLVRAFSTDGRFVAALHTVAGEAPIPFVIDAERGAATSIETPANARVAIAGFVEEAR